MATTSDDLVSELKRLRRGWGVRADLGTRLGPHLAELCGAATGDEPERRRKLCGHLTEGAGRLPEEMALAALVGLCLHSAAQFRQLEDRLEWLAAELGCSVRTATRRLDEALEMLAEELLRDVSSPVSSLDPAEGWYFESFKAFLRLDGETPEALEQRTIVATVDGVESLDTSISVPRHPDDKSDSHQLNAELLYGGRLELREQPYETYFRNVITLPNPLNVGDQHSYAMRVKPPPGQPMALHYVHVPLKRSDYFELRIRFNPTQLPRTVWRLTEVATAVIYEDKPTSDILEPDRFGEIQCEFRNLRQGYGYGVCWQGCS